MPNSVAEAYLLIVRESLVPVIGEAVPVPFTGQIELDSWKWDLKNDKRRKKKKEEEDKKKGGGADGASDKSDGGSDDKAAPQFKGDQLIRAVTDMQKKKGMDQLVKDKKVREMIAKAVGAHNNELEAADGEKEKKDDRYETDEDGENRMSFTFEKNVDLATTQLLNAMANGDVLPRAVLTLFHRSSNAPVTLAITFGDVRLKKYDLSVDPTDTMADLKETWEATYETLNWLYQNRPAASGPNFVTKGTARVFAMKVKLPF